MDIDYYYLNLIIEIAQKSTCKSSFEEKCSAAAIGLFYAINSYTPKNGDQYAFIVYNMNEAIEVSHRRKFAHKKVESDYSFDKFFGEFNDTMSFNRLLTAKTYCFEENIIFRDFLESLSILEKSTIIMLLQKYKLEEINEKLKCTNGEIIENIKSIQKKYSEYYED